MSGPSDALTLRFLCRFHLLFYSERFPRVNDINYRAWSCRFEIFQKRPSMTAIGIGGVYALGREVIEPLKISVPTCRGSGNGIDLIERMCLHHNFLFIGVLERFGPLDRVFALCAYRSAPAETSDVPTHN